MNLAGPTQAADFEGLPPFRCASCPAVDPQGPMPVAVDSEVILFALAAMLMTLLLALGRLRKEIAVVDPGSQLR